MKTKKLATHAFVKRVKDTISRYEMLYPGDKVLVAVSGGPDSLCLLKVLFDSARSLGIQVFAANMDHGIRGKASARDSDFVKKLCKKIGVKCAFKKISLKKGYNNKSLEECAREKRYAFLADAAKKYGCNVIVTGHTMDDQAETVLMRFLKGTSLRGLGGIPAVRGHEGVKVARPLIGVTKKEILDYLDAFKWKYRIDSTNSEVKYLRNMIRKKVLPYLEKINPQIRRTLANISDSVREELGSSELRLQKETFKREFEQAGGNIKKLTQRHWIDVEKFAKTAHNGQSLDLPGKVRVKKVDSAMIFES